MSDSSSKHDAPGQPGGGGRGPGHGDESFHLQEPARGSSRSWSALRQAYQQSQTPASAHRAPPPQPAEVPPMGPPAAERNGAKPAARELTPAQMARAEAAPVSPPPPPAKAPTPAAPAAEAPAVPTGPKVFRFRARGEAGRIVEGHLTAHSAQRTADLLRQRGFTPLEVTEVPQGALPAAETTKGKVKRRSVAVFTRQLSILYRSGVPLPKAISTLAAQPDDLPLHEVLIGVRRCLTEGYPLYRALGRYPQAFPPDYVAMVEAGEAAGMLDSVLDRLAENMERQVEMNGRLRSAMSYPAFVTILAVVMNLAIFKWILPNFEPVFASAGVELPWLTSVIMQMVRWTNSGWFWVALVTVPALVAWGVVTLSRAERMRGPLDQFLLKLPVYGPLYRRVVLVEIFSILQNLFSAGLPVQRSMLLASRVGNNRVYENAFRSIVERLKQGDGLGVAFNKHREVFSKLVIHMIIMGETLGKPVTSFRFLAEFYKTELDYILDGLAATIEPIMVALVGLMTGTVVLSVFLPIYRIVSSLI